VTQVVFTALYGNDVWDEEERKVNLAMLQNVLVSTTPHHPTPSQPTPIPTLFPSAVLRVANSHGGDVGQEPVLEVAKGTLRHVDLMQGRKAYPSQVRPRPTSARWLSSTNCRCVLPGSAALAGERVAHERGRQRHRLGQDH